MPRKSQMLRSLVKHFVARSRGMRHRGMGLGLAGGSRRRYRRVGGSIRRTIGAYHAPSGVVPNVVKRNPKKIGAAALAALGIGGVALKRHLGYGRRHRGGALRLAGQHGPVHVGVSRLGLTNLPQAY